MKLKANPCQDRYRLARNAHVGSVSVDANIYFLNYSISINNINIKFTMKTAVLATLIASAAAFAPAKTASQSSSAMSMSFDNELGAQAPLGFWVRTN
jgi:hypothetical protein